MSLFGPEKTGVLLFVKKFQRIGKLPHVIGARYRWNKHTNQSLKVDARFYISKDKKYAITLQAVCDAELRFLDCFAGFAGSVGDRRIFQIYGRKSMQIEYFILWIRITSLETRLIHVCRG